MMSGPGRCNPNQDCQTCRELSRTHPSYLRDGAAEILLEKCPLLAQYSDLGFSSKQVYKGKAPGTDTQVSVLEDTSSGYVVAVVDYNGFEKEMPKAPKAPSQKKK
jgi:hypothetical protein